MTKIAWFPDAIARWFDAFEHTYHAEKDFQPVRTTLPNVIHELYDLILRDPARAASNCEDFIEQPGYLDPDGRAFRRYLVLRAAQEALFAATEPRLEDLGRGWDEIWDHYAETGNLLKEQAGVLFPPNKVLHTNKWRRPVPAREVLHQAWQHFPRLHRWAGEPSVTLQRLPTELLGDVSASLVERLSIGLVPLLDSVGSFAITTLESGGDARFIARLRSPKKALARAIEALEVAGTRKCDIVIYPELCLSPPGQQALARRIRRIAKDSGGYPWLVIAGSAHCEVSGGTYHNKSLVFDRLGQQVLAHHKLFAYEMSTFEQERYGLSQAMKKVPRYEAISTKPFEFQVLDTPIGRLAIFICEDFSDRDLFRAARRIGVSWLFVPVLDGYQAAERWTGRCAAEYAGDGVGAIVVTSLSLAKAQLRSERKRRKRAPVTIIQAPWMKKPVIQTTDSDREPVVTILDQD